MAVDREHHPDQGWDQEHDDPGSVGELGDDHHHGHDAGHDSADGIDDETVPRDATQLSLGTAPPVNDHTRLGERECRKNADCVQRDECCHAGMTSDHQENRQHAERQDTGRKRETIPLKAKLAGQEAVARGSSPGAGNQRTPCSPPGTESMRSPLGSRSRTVSHRPACERAGTRSSRARSGSGGSDS